MTLCNNAYINKFPWVKSHERLSCDKGVTGGKEMGLMPLSGRNPEQKGWSRFQK